MLARLRHRQDPRDRSGRAIRRAAAQSVPIFGGVILDMCGLSGIRDVDATSLVVDVGPGTFGDRFEAELRSDHGLTCGHWPQSMTLSTVGGWVACRGAGQFSTRYGKIEDMVVGLDVALGRRHDDHHRRLPPDRHRSRPHPAVRRLRGNARRRSPECGSGPTRHPSPSRRGAWSFASFHGRARRVSPDPPTGRHPGRAPALRPDRVEAQLRPRRRTLRPHRPRRGRPGGHRRHVAGGRVGTGRGRVGWIRSSSVSWLEHRNDVVPTRVTHHRGASSSTPWRCRARWSTLPGLYDGCDGRHRLVRRDPVGVGALQPQLHRRCVPLLHVRRPAHRCRRRRSADTDRQGPVLPGRVGRRHPCRARRPAARCRTTTASASTDSGSWTRHWEPEWDS